MYIENRDATTVKTKNKKRKITCVEASLEWCDPRRFLGIFPDFLLQNSTETRHLIECMLPPRLNSLVMKFT